MKEDWERLKKVLWEKDVNANALAKLLQRSVQTFYDMKSRPNVGISKNLAEEIHTLYPDISESWLLTGKGEMKLYEIETMKNNPCETVECERCKDKDALITSMREQIELLREKIYNLQEKKHNKDG
ncbi:MAG TPA: hypothetical protein VFC67_02820 [Prolixibacteraceae bacterium]|nr:hypothetical protein [Prolixibacteraceae bacterium]